MYVYALFNLLIFKTYTSTLVTFELIILNINASVFASLGHQLRDLFECVDPQITIASSLCSPSSSRALTKIFFFTNLT